MAKIVERLKFASIAKGTRKQYAREWSKFERWALLYDQPVLPSSPLATDLYLGHLVLERKGVSTVRLALASIAEKHDRSRHTACIGAARSTDTPDYERHSERVGTQVHREASGLGGQARCVPH